MRLRPRQKAFVERSVSALNARRNTLGVAPTGAGKTIMLSGVPYTGGKLGFYFQGEPHTHVEAVNIATLP